MATKVSWENRGGTFALYQIRMEGRWKDLLRFGMTWPQAIPHWIRTKSFAKATLAHAQQILGD